ncbi:tripartite tricarboxylate transporter permease [Chelativorans intermedius]|uniref:Tripartite tricarboxylate transporter permease n=1 Tax=Chelativorans intermedius TaxID=515947 RepID=A0ABV6D680_9HYPH|nr:tripartite tricarboxylate transporter permease [Chelativorans intermedius]MCT8999391.1 tripartite tricarboxylate transporter permease [Chelativorans intermedius]
MDIAAILAAVLAPKLVVTVVVCTFYGAFVGAMPGLTATMAVALLVPFTYFMDPAQAVAAIVATTTTAIFAGDISGALLRMPGTPASAAYVEDSYAMARGGRPRTALFVSLFAACIGGIIGVAILSAAAPQLARVAARFSSDEMFWLACLGLSCAVFVGGASVPRNFASLFIGLAIATVGIDVAVGHPRFTFGINDLLDGISFIPAMIGMFAVAELLRNAETRDPVRLGRLKVEGLGKAVAAGWREVRGRKINVARSGIAGTVIGSLPGAGADVAAWICYAISRRFSRTPERFGKGHTEGMIDGGAANNAALAGAWTPALVFGIPGDSVTAIAIGVLLMKGLTPGPQIFSTDALLVYTLFGSFFLANLVMLLSGTLAILAATFLLRAPRSVLMPSVLILSMLGAYAILGSTTAIWIVLALGLLGYLMSHAEIPIAPAILGIVLGQVVEDNFMVSMMKAQGDLSGFFARETAAFLGVATILIWGLLLVRAGLELAGRRPAASSRETNT